MIRTTLLTLAAAGLAALGAAPALGAQQAQEQIGIALGAQAPGAVVHTLDGKAVNLSQYIGKTPVVLEFWATWCSNCKELEPAFVGLARQYASRIRFIDVAVSVNQSPERVKRYAEKHDYPQEMVYDTNGSAVEAYNVPATSYVVVIDRAGKVVYTGLGGDQDLTGAIRKVL